MIFDTLAHIDNYKGIHKGVFKGLCLLRDTDFSVLEDKRYELDGEDFFFITSYETQLVNDTPEAHQKYIDIHFPLSGKEIVGWKHLSNLGTSEAPFDTDNDFALYAEEPTTYFTVMPGEFYIVYPEDAHAPIIGEGTLRKLIVKVMID